MRDWLVSASCTEGLAQALPGGVEALVDERPGAQDRRPDGARVAHLSLSHLRRRAVRAHAPPVARTNQSVDVAAIRAYCEQRVPANALDQVRAEAVLTLGAVTLVERRAPWRDDYGPAWSTLPVARLRYPKTRREWTLHWRDRNARWHRHELTEPTHQIRDLIAEIDNDPTGIFWAQAPVRGRIRVRGG